MAKEKKFLYPIFKLPREYHDGIQEREIPKYIKWWLYNNYKKKHEGVLSDILLGTNFTLTDSLNRIFNIYEVQGNTLQEGTPAPDNECPIYNVTGNVNNKLQNKNLFNKNTVTEGYWLLTDGTTSAHIGFITSDYIEIDSNTNYYLTNTGTKRFKYYDENKNAITNTWDLAIAGSQTFTTPATAKYIRLSVDMALISIDSVQLEQGSTATQYVEHQEQNYALTLGNIELCKIADYKDYFYKENGKWYLHKEIGKVVIDGSEEWEYTEQYNYFRVTSYNFTDIPLDTSLQLSNYFKCIGVWSTFRDNTNLNGFFKILNIGYKLAFRNTNFDNVTDFKNWLATHNTKVYYPLETPTNTEVTDSTLISQLDAILQAYTYAEETNISSTTDGASPILKIQYWKKETENINLNINDRLGNILNAIKNSEKDEENEEIGEDINVDNEEIEEDNDFEESEVDDT